MKIKKILTGARISELDGLLDALEDFFEKSQVLQSDAILKKIFDELKTLSDKITDATKRDKTLSTLDEADESRDTAFRNLNVAISGLVKLPVPNLSENAKIVKEILGKFGSNLAEKPYLEESALITKLLQDLNEVKESISVLPGIAEMISALENAQKTFDEKREAYDVAKSEEGQKPCASSLKKPILSLVNEKFLPYLSIASESGYDYELFVQFVEKEIERVNTRVQGSKKSTTES